MQIVYSPRYHLDIGAHVYPTAKYRLVRDRLIRDGLAQPRDFVEPQPASWDDLALVHTKEYLDKARFGRFSPEEIAQLELPWSIDIAEGFRLMTGGTLLAARLALAPAGAESVAIGIHLGGGFHHAFANHGEGFCLFNDVAVAIRALVRDGAIRRAAVIDLDVHHGNGTAMIFGQDPSVFTFSMHQQHLYPLFKPRGSLDIGLANGTRDPAYLEALARALPKVFESVPDVLFYLAGADPYREDQLGGLGLTPEGLRERDRRVLAAARAAGVPVVVTLAGGYAVRLEDTVTIQTATIAEALALE